jgi:hypothetical protein
MSENPFTQKEKVTTSSEFLRLVEDEAVLYLAVGDQEFTKDGLTLKDMFAKFENNEYLLVDFLHCIGKEGIRVLMTDLEAALVELRDSGEITDGVYQHAQSLVHLLLNGKLRIFNHGPNSVVFNWEDEGGNIYLTVEEDHLSVMTSTPERILRKS